MTNKPPDISVEGRLPRRQRDVLDGLKAGYSEKHIAEELGISPHTVHVHVKALYRRFEVRSRGELLSLWVRGKREAIGTAPGRAEKRSNPKPADPVSGTAEDGRARDCAASGEQGGARG